jgi:hypothetical protein
MAFDDETVTFFVLERSGTGQFHIKRHYHEVSYHRAITFKHVPLPGGPSFRVASRLMISSGKAVLPSKLFPLAAAHHRRTPWDFSISCVDQASRSN